MLYRYWTVRYVPDSVRPDTVGVGVIVADEQNTDSASRFVTKVSDIPNIGGPRKFFRIDYCPLTHGSTNSSTNFGRNDFIHHRILVDT